MDGSYLNRWASWVAGLVVTVGACSRGTTADRGGPMSAFLACAGPSVWDLAPLPAPCRGRLEVRRATLMLGGRPAGDPPANVETVLRAVLGFVASPEAWPFLDTALRKFGRSPRVADHVTLYVVELRVSGGHAC